MTGLNLLMPESTIEFVKCCKKVGGRGKGNGGTSSQFVYGGLMESGKYKAIFSDNSNSIYKIKMTCI